MSSHEPPGFAPFDHATDPIHDLDFEEMDIHGKLVALNAVDLSSLTLANRCAMVLLAGSRVTDDFGRFMGPPGFVPDLSPLSKRQTSVAIRALIEKGLVNTWTYEGSHCWEVAGAYAFKKNLKARLAEIRRLARLKRVLRKEREMRRSEEFHGESYLYDDDGAPNSDNVVEFIRTTRGGHVPMRPTVFFRSKVPTPKGVGKFKMIAPQPKDERGCVKHLYPSFNVYKGLSPLGVVIRHLLIWEADDYGRVRIDILGLHAKLGPAITKRASTNDIEQEINRMSASGHLLVIRRESRRESRTYAYVRDAAQHMKEKKFKNMDLPRLVDDREFTHDSADYRAFFASWRAHTIGREKVRIVSYQKEDVLHVVYEYVEVAAKRFAEKYHELMSSERYAAATPETILEVHFAVNTMHRMSDVELFYYGCLKKMSCQWMESFYRECDRKLSDPNENDFKILRYLMKMTPLEYLQKLRDEAPIESVTG